jgi:dolichyl-phosphate beta-glucosyltransferase
MNLSPYDAYRQWASTPLTEDPVVSVVIPAYNESERILPTIGAIAAHMSARGEAWELLVADDGSRDNTVALLNDLGLVNARVLVAERNGGKGSAVRRGVLAARGSYILFADADQSTPIEQFDQLLEPIRSGRYDIVIGSRAHLSAEETKKSVLRRTLSWGLNRVVRTVSRISIRDTQCGFKLFRADVAQDLFGRQKMDGFSFDLELLFLASKLKYRTLELPVEWIDAPGSKVDATKVSIEFLRDLWKIRRNDLAGVYGTRTGRARPVASSASRRDPAPSPTAP